MNIYPGQSMPLIHHVVTGQGRPPIVFVHGFGCGLADWDAQVAYFSPRHQTVAVNLRGHGASPGMPDECSIERYGADVAEVIETLALPPVVLVGHSMGCRVVIEAATQATGRVAGVVLVGWQPVRFSDGSHVEGDVRHTRRLFNACRPLVPGNVFTTKSKPAVITAVVERAGRLPRAIGEKVLLDMVRYDTDHLARSLGSLRVPVMAIQTTYSNERRERRSMTARQTTPYLDMLRARIPSVRIEIIEDAGHFPQIEEPDRTNALIDGFIAALPTRPSDQW